MKRGKEKYIRMASVFLCVLILLGLLTARKEQWSQEEKDNALHLVESLSLKNKAATISNKGHVGVMSLEEGNEILRLYSSALKEAKLVTDDVLKKAHPDLPKYYRLYFQKGLELCLSSWENKKPYEVIQGSALLDTYGEWLDQHRKEIKIPQ